MSGRSVARVAGGLIGAAGVAFCLTLVSLSMRSVQSIGGSCASGGPYQISHQCPTGVAGLLPLGIVGGLVFLGVFYACSGDGGRSLILLAWSALFLSLGWNFFDYGLNLTTTGQGTNAGFLVSGVIFILMGGIPLVWLIPRMWQVLTGHDDDTSADTIQPIVAPTGVRFNPPASTSFPSPSFVAPAAPPPAAGRSSTKDVASELERLADLHRRGDLTDAEYETAKRQALSDPRWPT